MNINTHKIQNTLNGIKSYYYNNKSFYSATSRSKYGKSLNGILYSMNLALEMKDYEYIENNFEKVLKLVSEFVLNIERNSKLSRHSRDYQILQILALFLQAISSYKDKTLIENCFKNNLWIREICESCFLDFNENNFLKKLNFRNHWHDSNVVMAVFSLAACYCKFYKFNESDLINLFRSIDHKVSNLQSSKMGFHKSTALKYKGLLQGLASTYHYIPMYRYMYKQIKYKSKINESIYKMNTLNGLFALPYGHACIDLDAAIIMEYIGLNSENNFSKDNFNILLRFVDTLTKIQNQDGGYSIYGTQKDSLLIGLLGVPDLIIKTRCLGTILWNLKCIIRSSRRNHLTISNSSYDSCSIIKESTMFSTWFRLLSLKSALKQLNIKEFSNKLNYEIYQSPYLGYF